MVCAFDTETELFRPGRMAPKMVCLSITDDVNVASVIHVNDPMCKDIVYAMLTCGDVIVGEHVAYDMGVICEQWPEFMPLVFEAYDEDRVTDTRIRQKLVDIAWGHYRGYWHSAINESGENVRQFEEYKYTLQALAARHGYPVVLDKDTWRLRYGELIDKPVQEWERGAVEYSEHDAKSTLWVWKAQEESSRFLDDQFRQARASWALHLVSAYGIRTDAVMIEHQRRKVQARLDASIGVLQANGFVYRGKDGKWHKRTKAIQEYALGVKPDGKVTPKGKVKLDEDAIADYGDNAILKAYSEYSSASKMMPHVKELENGIWLPIHTRFEELATTGRVTSSDPNMQNRETAPGDRECFVARRGHVFCDIDYEGLELRTLAQVCKWGIGKSRLADVLNAGRDPHNIMAAEILKISEDDAAKRKKNKADTEFKRARDVAKIANFGLGGGLGVGALVNQARVKEGIILSPEEGRRLIDTWKRTWPEMREYFNQINELMEDDGPVMHFKSRRYRGGATYTELCNTFFQGLGSDATKCALYELVKACYVGDGPLVGSRVVNYIHDEFLVELPEDDAPGLAKEVQRIVEDAANRWLPDLKVKAEPDLTRRWSKLAGSEKDGVVDENGVWEWNEAIKAGSTGYAE